MTQPDSDSQRHDAAIEAAVARYLALRHSDPDADLEAFLESQPEETRSECRQTILAALAFEELEPRARRDAHETERIIGDYRLIREIGRGGMGVVYEAQQISLARRVAVKILPSGFLATPRQVERFRREGAAVAKLQHPGIVPIYTIGEIDGTHFFAMELVEGISLDQLIEELRAAPSESSDESRLDAPSPMARLTEIVAQVAEALHYSHEQGIIHRDVKPQNIILGAKDRPRLVDFGLAKDHEAGSLSVTGDLVGTVHYMSPEQLLARSAGVDHRTDVYSLGVVLYELLTLQLPFQGRSAQEILVKINSREPRPIRKLNPMVPRDLETICLKAMAKDAGSRYATAGEMAGDLRRFLRLEPIHAKPPGRFERALKWARREPAKALAATLAGLIVLGGPTAIAIVLEIARQEAVRERNDKNRALARAEENAQDAMRASVEAQKQAARYMAIDAFVDRFLFSVAPGNQGERITMLEVVDEAAKELEANPPAARDVEVELRRKLGTTYSLLGRFPEARAQLEKGLEGAASLPETATFDALRAELHFQLGKAFQMAGRSQESIRSFRQSLDLRRKYSEEDTGEIAAIKSNIVLARAASSKGYCMWDGQLEALAPFVRLTPEEFEAQSRRALARVRELWDSKRPDDALAFVADTIEPYTKVPEVIVERGHIGTGIANIASFRAEIGDFSAAIPIAEYATMFFREHGVAPSDDYLLTALTTYGQILLECDRFDRAEAVFAERLQTVDAVLSPLNPVRTISAPLLARVWLLQGRLREAEALMSRQATWTLQHRLLLGILRTEQYRWEEAAALTLAFISQEPTVETFPMKLIASELLRRTGRVAEAHTRTKVLLEWITPDLVSDCEYNRQRAEYLVARAQPELARNLMALGRYSEAETALHASRDALARICGAGHPYTLDALEASIELAVETGSLDRARDWASQLVARTPEEHPAREGRGMLRSVLSEPERLLEHTLGALGASSTPSKSFQYLLLACELRGNALASASDRAIVMGCAHFAFGNRDRAAAMLGAERGSSGLAEALRLTVLAACQAGRGNRAAAGAMAGLATASIDALPEHQAKALTARLERALEGD